MSIRRFALSLGIGLCIQVAVPGCHFESGGQSFAIRDIGGSPQEVTLVAGGDSVVIQVSRNTSGTAIDLVVGSNPANLIVSGLAGVSLTNSSPTATGSLKARGGTIPGIYPFVMHAENTHGWLISSFQFTVIVLDSSEVPVLRLPVITAVTGGYWQRPGDGDPPYQTSARIEGQHLLDQGTVSVQVAGTGIVVDAIRIDAVQGDVIADMSVNQTAALGINSLTLSNDGGTSNPSQFIVVNHPPRVTSMTPRIVETGSSVNVVFDGNYLEDLSSVAVEFDTGRFSFTDIVPVSKRQAQARLSVASNASFGRRGLIFTNSGGETLVYTDDGPIFVVPPIIITAQSHVGGARGQTIDLQLTGSGFGYGDQNHLEISGPAGITIVSESVPLLTRFEARLQIAVNATLGDYLLTVVSGQRRSNNVSFAVVP